MYKCMCCNHEFEEPSREREMFGEYSDEVDACPYCHCDGIKQHEKEDIYGDYIYPGDVYYIFGGEDVVAEQNLKEYIKDCEYEA